MKSGIPSPVTSAVAVRTVTVESGKNVIVSLRRYGPPVGVSSRAFPSAVPPTRTDPGTG